MTEFENKDAGTHEAELRDLEPKQDEQAEPAVDEVKGGRKAGGGQQDYLIVKMSDVIISG